MYICVTSGTSHKILYIPTLIGFPERMFDEKIYAEI